MFELSADKAIRQRCLARQDFYRTQNTYKKAIDDLAKEKERITKEMEHVTDEKNRIIMEKDSEIDRLKELLVQNGITI
ncbi:MAG: hypothetical protein IJ711_10600 [Lachnospiraceae bacterium]|nr:hypothetical protein [Lachnospiraceae bacterium]